MNKDVLYIDVEDDITTIIGKVKASKSKIIALVPPKRVGVLQSAVNLRLLTRTAEANGKRIVLITNDHALAGLAASAQIPVAKNLQSKPEIAEIPALKVDDGDDIIDGRDLPVSELQKSTKKPISAGAAAVNAVIAENDTKVTDADKKAKAKKNAVPNFNVFRKKFVLIGGGALLLIGFLIWAIWFAPRATVIITAKTTTVTVDEDVSLGTDATTETEKKTVKALRQEQKQDMSVEFTATGKKKVGERATGRVRISTRDIDLLDKTVPAGTQLTADGMVFTTNSAVTFTRQNYTGVTVAVTALEIGDEYNGVSGRATGAPEGVTATLSEKTSGGSSREATVVSDVDITKAIEALDAQKDSTLKTKLEKAFGSSAMVIGESYKEERSTPTPSIAVGGEASGAVTLKATVTASMFAIDNADMETYLKGRVGDEIKDKASQKVYKYGADKVKFTQYAETEGGAKVRVTANAVVGPTIDESKAKEQSKGKSYGDIQGSLESIEGVQDVDIKFSPFWVRTVPNDVKRITIEFKLQDAN